MSNDELYHLITSLPPHLQREVTDFAEFLVKKEEPTKPKPKRQFGFAKGLITYMALDFDEPLNDFKEYM